MKSGARLLGMGNGHSLPQYRPSEHTISQWRSQRDTKPQLQSRRRVIPEKRRSTE
jgi:hypothetical protein